VQVAERSGALLASLVPSIRRTAELVEEVAAASQEQSSGVAQINRAMASVDQVTQRNASASEELSSTAEAMSAQAEALKAAVGFFKLAEGAAPPAPALRSGNGHALPPAGGLSGWTRTPPASTPS
jgi:methyl-accepting chemotaxis protein